MTDFNQKIKNLKKIISENGFAYGLLALLKNILPQPLNGIIYVIIGEIKNISSVSLPWNQRLDAYKLGLPSHLYKVYDIPNSSNPRLYFSEFSAEISNRILHKNKEILSDKMKFYKFMNDKGFIDYLPNLIGIIEEGEFKGKKNLTDFLKSKTKLILKPKKGSGGKGIYIFEMNKGKIIVKGCNEGGEDLKSIIKKLDDYLVMDYCEQSKFLQDIYPESANTIRILVMFPDNEEPFLAHACLRIGNGSFVDNVQQGGLSAKIDLETGELSPAAEILSSGEVKWHKKHPVTDSQIENVTIPNWNKFKSNFISFNQKFSEFNLIAWDILFTERNKFKIIEGNNGLPDYKLHKVHGPLLEKQKVRKFFKDYNIPI